MGKLENWDFNSIYNTKSEQINRQKSAIKCQILELNRETKEALFTGQNSPDIKTSLTNCSCYDFNFIGGAERKKFVPCMHIYRLAIELGVMEAKYFSKPKKTAEEKKGEELEKIHALESDSTKWGDWKTEIHLGSAQKDRQHRAYEILEDKDFEFRDGDIAEVHGYRTTLQACTCPDFEERKAPCKHIYFLALAKGYKLAVTYEEFKKEQERFDKSFVPLMGLGANLEGGDLKIFFEDYTKKDKNGKFMKTILSDDGKPVSQTTRKHKKGKSKMGKIIFGVIFCFIGFLFFITSVFDKNSAAMVGGLFLSLLFIIVGIILFVASSKAKNREKVGAQNLEPLRNQLNTLSAEVKMLREQKLRDQLNAVSAELNALKENKKS